MNRRMDFSLSILLLATAVLAVLASLRSPSLLGQALMASTRVFSGVWLELILGFVLAGLLEVLIPEPVLMRYLGSQSSGYGILMGSMIGLVLPGGPYLVFPIVANLLRQGAAPGPLIALLTAKALLSPIRILSYEAPLLGWPLTFARLIPGLFLPPFVGLIGQWLFDLFARKP